MSRTILVTGGCGYIGSHTIVDLVNNNFNVVCIDDNSNSSATVVEQIYQITGKKIIFFQVDITNWKEFSSVLNSLHQVDGIIHFAAYKSVNESVKKPILYYQNNLVSLLNILKAIQKYSIPNFIFSSSCSVYGNVYDLPVTEKTPIQQAKSPYGRTKQMGEDIIKDFINAYPDKKAILLRYFNPAGAHESGLIGEDPINQASSLIPVITEVAIGKRKNLTVFGNDYPTRDGSCIRDYIHVVDLANAHTKCLNYLLKGNNEDKYEIFNVGIGQGVTVFEAIKAFEEVTSLSLSYVIGPRRKGDVMAIYADYKKAKNKLGWIPSKGIKEIMESAWQWEKRKAREKALAGI